MSKSPNLVLDTPVSEWIAAFNRARGWKSLRGRNTSRPDAENLRASPKRQLQEDRAFALDGDRSALLRDVIAQQEDRLDALDAAIANPPADADIDALQQEREDLAIVQASDKADLAIVERVDAHVAQLRAVEGHLRQDVADVREEIRRLEAQGGAVPLEDLDQDLLAQFRQQHVMVQGNIERARAEVMKITSVSDGKTLSYAIINGAEYKILFGMLEQAILIVGTGDLAAAIDRVAQTQTQLNTYRTARTGATALDTPVSEHGDLDGPMGEVASQISLLRGKGMPTVAEQFEYRHEALSATIQNAIATNAPDLRDTYLKQVTDLGQEVTAAHNQALQVVQIWADTRTDIATLRANGHRVRPERCQRKLDECMRLAEVQAHMPQVLEDAREVAEYVRARLDKAKEQDLRRSNLKPAEMQVELAVLEDKFHDFFKTNSAGEIITQKDTKSGEQKGKKKNRDLPRGALEEIELQMLAARQLIESDSVDALKTADEYLAGVATFIRTIEENPDIYVTLSEGFTRVEKSIAKTKKLFPLYEPGRLLDFTTELGALRANHLTQPQETVTQDTDDLHNRVMTFRAEMLELQTLKRSLAKQADAVDQIIESIGKRLKKDQTGFVQFDGYYGPEVARMSTIRDQIAERSPASLKQAAAALIQINGNLGWLLSILKKQKAGETLEAVEAEHVEALLSVARSGQLDHDANEAKKEEFKSGISELTTLLDETKDALKGDQSEITRLEAERDGLKAETKKTGGYIDGLAKLQGLNSRAAQLAADVRKANAIMDGDLTTAARNCAHETELFSIKLGTFVEDVIEPAGATDGGNQLDQPPLDANSINGFFTNLQGSLQQVNLAEMSRQAARVADRSETISDRKIARKTALQELRKLMALFDSFAPMQHFRSHPFATAEASDQMVSARKALPLLEMRLLTAIKD
ncbi:hypothetical protein HKX54_15525 [Sulfitobacter sp. M57]|uniref:hypothetical protein n=1 Tax=unclassified Sulfitobacter TaxID=196795 RepID=UPI0023E27403|nr:MULTISPECIES: hypothetical protein [unclassified Sulfitobacter]MDF3415878.1 hypothetical protein [Sulfitobacter sp. KE5]MDF3423358.1 hypothetical protein [Sulfitobacter sp. KE43]MDF3434424.1 hypothetical protein [Sulfitobacter sp. KE42]MDF3460064.1 hypothetical protein [Sulfitobacter sp. S74]MDF3463962.1 hypothetical protein [Sulfitobacter sp. Ks18]